MRTITLLGATGSIGRSALAVIERHPDRFRLRAAAALRDVEGMAAIVHRHRPARVALADPEAAARLRAMLDGCCEVLSGEDALLELAAEPETDTVIAAIVGAKGLAPTLAAAQAGKRILLANKESAVVGGRLLLESCQRSGARLIPIDSEHNAIFQCLPPAQDRLGGVERIVLTASGGPFRGRKRESLIAVTPEEAVAHPNWRMGAKISVDSASLMNKGLEVIEAHILFGIAPERIEVVVHPQSIVHALVAYRDGSVLAELALPDMRVAIAHALAWPERMESGVPPLDLGVLGRLDFEPPDRDTFRCLDLAYRCLEAGGSGPLVLNAANEVAVAHFLARRLPFLAIPELIERTIERFQPPPAPDLAGLIAQDAEARRVAEGIAASLAASGTG
ncbi:MAG: 1-deoxy-D-xylulose 5-phosphate reductoisomerase [Lysobacterales bacterium]|jgi:1-deoxy-D-xylulose-5-phosphate reductoisomerase|nr:MAG: 1-deoxy-D-xylulose 5-phosphate reductoisomerase [Xanthomonadales bacterium]